MAPDNPLSSILIASGSAREGKTTVAVSLAIVMAQAGKRVLLVDTDLRRPRVHKVFGLSNAKGITSVLVGEATLHEVVQETFVPNLFVVPCGAIPPTPSELLHSKRFNDLVEEAKKEFFIVFDSPPIGAVTDAAVIAPQVDGTILVVKAGQTNVDSLRSAVRQIHDVGAQLIGSILNDVDLTEQRDGYGSYYYYSRQEVHDEYGQSQVPA